MPTFTIDKTDILPSTFDTELALDADSPTLKARLDDDDSEIAEMHLRRLRVVTEGGQLALQKGSAVFSADIDKYKTDIDTRLQEFQIIQQATSSFRAKEMDRKAQVAQLEQQASEGNVQLELQRKSQIAQLNLRRMVDEYTNVLNLFRTEVDRYKVEVDTTVEIQRRNLETRDLRVKQWFFQYQRLTRLYKERRNALVLRNQEQSRPIHPIALGY